MSAVRAWDVHDALRVTARFTDWLSTGDAMRLTRGHVWGSASLPPEVDRQELAEQSNSELAAALRARFRRLGLLRTRPGPPERSALRRLGGSRVMTPGLSSRLVGREVTFTPSHGSEHHGVITRASYSPMGETVLVIHLDDDPIAVCVNTVLIGPDAEAVVASLDAAA
jgi:hypothetical protein